MGIKTLLRDEIQSEFDILKGITLGTEEYKITVDGLVKLVDRSIELDKLETEFDMQVDDKEKDIELKMEQLRIERRDQWVKNGIAVAGLLLPIGITIWGTYKTFEFEKTGTITTIMGRGFINKLTLKK